jgi:hypothetical protein
MPNVRILDFQKVKAKERSLAKKLFLGESGKNLITELLNNKLSKEDNVEYFKAVEKSIHDEEQKKMIYVLYNFLSIRV